MQLSLIKEREEEIQLIIQYWIRILKIKLGWIHNFDKLVVNYTSAIFMLITFHSSSKLLKTLTGHTDRINSIDYSSFDDNQLLCSGSDDKTVRVWDIENNKQIQSFNGHSSYKCHLLKIFCHSEKIKCWEENSDDNPCNKWNNDNI
ncbi:WD-40 repeat-containing protein [Reticulomyxa filosa]|uniref:WD-40 repeat-containing protein n=1 Tax=Reticulomyxa filosa TaxID=46433 RepID=X6LY96_RETFI|nr:WD-40 repeat-containing protein [Reticulomyxa filosa]|eukprot:ETO06137.1 WD-40 repeat-containing protein [Reticulomyxa filosa]